MKIGLVDVDSHHFPNLALMKISAYHKAKGDAVKWLWQDWGWFDRVYLSKVFDDTYSSDYKYIIGADEIVKGGTGYGLKNTLPPEVEHCCPDYTLYPQFKEAYGFITRGCPNNCPFCIVTTKEGAESKQVADLSEFWHDQKAIKLLDPNILACKDSEKLLQQLIDSKAWVDFTQGLDIRLITKDNQQLLRKIKTRMLHFAWDNPKEDLTSPLKAWKKYSSLDRRRMSVYVLTNFNSTIEEDLWRINTLREIGYDPYVMVYDKPNAPREKRLLQRWANNKRIFMSIPDFRMFNPKLG